MSLTNKKGKAIAATQVTPSPDDRLQYEYIDKTVAPALFMGMYELAKKRPDDPLGFLAAFLIKYKKDQEKSSTPEK